jgi:hypothetical protein
MAGLWDQQGVPHKGWSCVYVDDLGEGERQICGMCRHQEIRYVHSMQHLNYPSILEVGCECAATMEGSYVSAHRRESRLKSTAGKRKRWLSRKWRVSAKGNPFLNTKGYNIAIYQQGAFWGAKLTHELSKKTIFSQKPYRTEDEAKMAAFNQLIVMESE